MGAGVVVAQYLGAKDRKEGGAGGRPPRWRWRRSSASILTIGGIFISRSLLTAMDTPGGGAGRRRDLYAHHFGGVLFSVVYNMAAGILNAAGNSPAVAAVSGHRVGHEHPPRPRCSSRGEDGRGRCGHRHGREPARFLRAVAGLLMRVNDDYRVTAKEIKVHKEDGCPHHQGGSAHRHSEHGHLAVQHSGPSGRQRLRCRRYGRFCGIYEGGRLQHPAHREASAWRPPPLWARTTARARPTG